MPEKLNLSEQEVERRLSRFRLILQRYLECKCVAALELCLICWYEMLFLLANNGYRGPQNMSNIYSLLCVDSSETQWVRELAGLRHSIAHCTLAEDEAAINYLRSLDWKQIVELLGKAFDDGTICLLNDVHASVEEQKLGLNKMDIIGLRKV